MIEIFSYEYDLNKTYSIFNRKVYHVFCKHCCVGLSFEDADIKELENCSSMKSYISCPNCNHNVFIERKYLKDKTEDIETILNQLNQSEAVSLKSVFIERKYLKDKIEDIETILNQSEAVSLKKEQIKTLENIRSFFDKENFFNKSNNHPSDKISSLTFAHTVFNRLNKDENDSETSNDILK